MDDFLKEFKFYKEKVLKGEEIIPAEQEEDEESTDCTVLNIKLLIPDHVLEEAYFVQDLFQERLEDILVEFIQNEESLDLEPVYEIEGMDTKDFDAIYYLRDNNIEENL